MQNSQGRDEVSFGRWLQQRRRALDLTQAELGREVGVAADTIHKIETDARRPSKEVAERLATCLAISPELQPAFLHFARGESSSQPLPPLPRHVLPITGAVLKVEPATALPVSPYKLLDYYDSNDAAVFFGRDVESLRLGTLVGAHRLVLVYGASGVGKTSLLLAGLVPRLLQAEPPFETVYVRALEDPALAIRRAVSRRLPNARLPEASRLVDYLATAAHWLGRPLVVMLDQFEEFFIRLSLQFRSAFISELGELYDARDVPVRIVLSLREDWLATVSELEARIPEVFNTRMRILPLTREQARTAITAPVARQGVSYEPTVVEQLLDDLTERDASIIPPQVQLVCGALYNKLQADERAITMSHYTQLGGPRGVLGRYLEDELSRFGREERAMARRIMEELVTSLDTKAVKTETELARALQLNNTAMQPVLEKLIRARLVRVLEREDSDRSYELTHEYLIREIGHSPDVFRRKQAEELIRQELENHARFGMLLAADKMDLVYEARATLRLNSEEQAFLLRTALRNRHPTSAFWLGYVEDEAQRANIARESLGEKDAAIRRWTAEVLSEWDSPIVQELLVHVALHDPSRQVRRYASRSLASSSDTAVAALLHAPSAGPERKVEALADVLDVAGRLPGLPVKTQLWVLRTLFVRRLKQAGRIVLYRTLAGALGAALLTAVFLVPLVYSDPGSFIDELGTASPANEALIFGMVGGGLSGLLGGAVALCFTVTEVLSKHASLAWHLVGAVSAGILMGLMFVLLRLADVVGWGSPLSFGGYFAFWSAVGTAAWGATAFVAPTMRRRRSLVIQPILVALVSGAACFATTVLLILLIYGVVTMGLVSEFSPYAILLGVTGGGMALGLGIVDRWSEPFESQRITTDTDREVVR